MPSRLRAVLGGGESDCVPFRSAPGLGRRPSLALGWRAISTNTILPYSVYRSSPNPARGSSRTQYECGPTTYLLCSLHHAFGPTAKCKTSGAPLLGTKRANRLRRSGMLSSDCYTKACPPMSQSHVPSHSALPKRPRLPSRIEPHVYAIAIYWRGQGCTGGSRIHSGGRV